MKLTPKQKKFCDYYIQTGNATQSAIKAGYSKKTAKVIGKENLTKPYLNDYIRKRNKVIESERIADMKEVKEFWTNILRDKNLDPKDRLKASEYIAKTNAAFTENINHSGNINHEFQNLSEKEIQKSLEEIRKTNDE